MIDYGVLAFFEENFGQITQKISQKLIYYYSTQSLAHSNLKCQKSGNRSKNYYTKEKITYLNFKRHFEWLGGVFIFIYFLHFGFCWHLLYAYSSYHPFRLQCGILFFCLTMNNNLESDKKKVRRQALWSQTFPISKLWQSFLSFM